MLHVCKIGRGKTHMFCLLFTVKDYRAGYSVQDIKRLVEGQPSLPGTWFTLCVYIVAKAATRTPRCTNSLSTRHCAGGEGTWYFSKRCVGNDPPLHSQTQSNTI